MAFLSRSYSTLFRFTVNFFNYFACQRMQDVSTTLNISPFQELSSGCALEWQYQIHPSRGLSILIAPKVKEPLLMSFSYILSKGKHFYLNFRLAKRNNLKALSCATYKGHFFCYFENKSGFKICVDVCVCPTACSFLWENMWWPTLSYRSQVSYSTDTFDTGSKDANCLLV